VIHSRTHADKGIRLFEKLNLAWGRRYRLAGAPAPGWGCASEFSVPRSPLPVFPKESFVRFKQLPIKTTSIGMHWVFVRQRMDLALTALNREPEWGILSLGIQNPFLQFFLMYHRNFLL